MKALLCVEHGPPEKLVYADTPTPEPGPGQVRIRVAAAGVNFPDTLIIRTSTSPNRRCRFRRAARRRDGRCGRRRRHRSQNRRPRRGDDRAWLHGRTDHRAARPGGDDPR